jgi:GDSL/SGNH-like Acyl-Esterase family found in Pmr5 and Cas1p
MTLELTGQEGQGDTARVGEGPQCRGTEYTDGHWEYRPPAKKSFYCCGSDYPAHRDAPYIGYGADFGICKNDSDWREHHFYWYRGSDVDISHVGGGGCFCDAANGRTEISEREKYVWVPSNCSLTAWDAKRFCSLLGSRTILMVGDSTMQQVAATLTGMIFTGKGGCNSQIFFGKSYILSQSPQEQKSLVRYMTENMPALPDICIYNVGVHINDAGDMYDILENVRLQLAETIAPKKHNISYVWKTVNPAHFSCAGKAQPFRNYSDFHMIDAALDKYHWNLCQKYDEIGRAFQVPLNFSIIDMTPLYLRPDAHPGEWDCLHYCVPGPLDLFSVLLLNMLTTNEV